eukprot:6779430-Alexandrium_andersonii.AAC.1
MAGPSFGERPSLRALRWPGHLGQARLFGGASAHAHLHAARGAHDSPGPRARLRPYGHLPVSPPHFFGLVGGPCRGIAGGWRLLGSACPAGRRLQRGPEV